jgi:hypothetical protein
MRKFLFLLLALSIVACKNVEQYKAGIDELVTKWDGASTATNEFATMVEASKAAHGAALDSMKLDTTFLAKLKGADLDKVKAAIGAYTASGNGILEVGSKLAEFKSGWDAKSAEVAALKDGLAAGKLEGDVTAKIAELTSFLATADTQLTSMKDAIAKSSEGSTTALDALKTVVAPFIKK